MSWRERKKERKKEKKIKEAALNYNPCFYHLG
jgi:hypothetical protein